MGGMPQPVIEVQDLNKAFGENRVLDRISFTVAPGETLVVLGRSGTGKSVLLKNLIGLLEPDGGQALIFGRNLAAMSERRRLRERRRIGYVFQGAALFDSLSVFENVGFPLLEARMPIEKVRRRVESRLQMVGLAHTIDQLPAELSGGMRKRVALARALVDLPDVVLYDEPTTGLDPLTTDVINQIILRLQSTFQTTSVVVTHDIHSAFTIADRIIMLDQGRIIAEGPPEEIRQNRQPWVQHFVQGNALESESIDSGMFTIGTSTRLVRPPIQVAGRESGNFPAPETAAPPRPPSGRMPGMTSGSVRLGAIRNRGRRLRKEQTRDNDARSDADPKDHR